MKVLFVEPTFGISGDMFNGALLDIKDVFGQLEHELLKLNITGVKITTSKVKKQYLNSTLFKVVDETDDVRSPKSYSEIVKLIDDSDLHEKVKKISKAAFKYLAEVEASIHNVLINEVHFHEIGAIDSIFDIVSAAILVHLLEIDYIFSTPIANGTNKAVKSDHGFTFCASPAAVKLQESMKSVFLPVEAEISTPTGVAILKALNANFKGTPKMMVIEGVGYGAGTKDFEHPNVLRATLGDMEMANDYGTADNASEVINFLNTEHGSVALSHIGNLPEPLIPEDIFLMSTNLDDVTSEVLSFTVEKLLNSGALDAWVTPIVMKKNRPAFELHAISLADQLSELLTVILSETKTLGIRVKKQVRFKLDREIIKVKVDGCEVALKVSPYGHKAEYDDLVAASKVLNRPLSDIKKQAEALYLRDLPSRSSSKKN